MSTALMTEQIAKTSPRFTASDFRALSFRTPYFRTKTAGVFYLLSVLTAAFAEIFVRGRLNLAGGLVAASAMIAVTLLFYDILSPVNRSLSLLAASFNLVGLAFEVLRSQPQGVNIAIVFNGFFCMLVGCLVFRSTSWPRILGALTALGGLGWLTFLSSPLAHYLFPYNLAFGLLGEGAVCLWLILTGANLRRWNERAGQQESRRRSPQTLRRYREPI
jgi:hypothetical protein